MSGLLQWYRIRDMLIGDNFVDQDVKGAIELASHCEHAESVYLTKIFAGKNVTTKEEARSVFLEQGENDAVAMCLGELVFDDDWDISLLRRSAELGYGLAQARMSGELEGPECFEYAKQAAFQGEREGYFYLGCCFKCADGTEKNLDEARECFRKAVELGSVFAMRSFGELLDDKTPEHWFWLGQAARKGVAWPFLASFPAQLKLFICGIGIRAVVFTIGEALNRHVDIESRSIFGDREDFDLRLSFAITAITFFNAQLAACKKAVDTWTLVGLRLNVHRDIRKMISKLIWQAKDVANYKETQ